MARKGKERGLSCSPAHNTRKPLFYSAYNSNGCCRPPQPVISISIKLWKCHTTTFKNSIELCMSLSPVISQYSKINDLIDTTESWDGTPGRIKLTFLGLTIFWMTHTSIKYGTNFWEVCTWLIRNLNPLNHKKIYEKIWKLDFKQ